MNGIRIFSCMLLIVGVILQPVGWMHFTWVAVLSFILILAGVFLLYASREQATDEGGGEIGPRLTGREMPADVHGHSGQYSGGRSAAWESHGSSDAGSSSD